MLRCLRNLFFLGCSLGLTACILDPHQSLKQPINIPKDWSSLDRHMTKTAKTEVCFPWWHQYHDPALNHLIARGLRYNNDIQVAMANVEAAQGELKRIEYNWIPTLAGGVGYSSFPYLGYPGVLLAVFPNYTINVFNQIKAQQKARHEVKVTQAMRHSVRLTVIAQIAGSYFSHLAQTEELQLLRTIESDLNQSLDINIGAAKGGIATDINIAKARTKLELIRAEEKIVEKNLVYTQNALRYLMNQNPCTFEFKQQFAQVDSQHMVIGTLPLLVIEHRPDMIAATEELKATRAGIGVALSNFLPSINLSMARGDIATVPSGYTLGMPIYFNQALLTQPFVTLTSLGDLKKARGQSKAAYYHYVDTLRKVLRDVDNDLASHEFFTQRLIETVAAKESSKRSYQLNRDLYERGIASYLSLLGEKVKLDELRVLVNKRKIDQTMAIINLYQDLAVGYGYTPRPEHKMLMRRKFDPLGVAWRAIVDG